MISICGESKNLPHSQPWVQCNGITLLGDHRNRIVHGAKLNDFTINMAQQLLKAQFPTVTGLQLTLLQSKEDYPALNFKNSIQIIHSRGDHWIVASRASSGVVKFMILYMTLFTNKLRIQFGIYLEEHAH